MPAIHWLNVELPAASAMTTISLATLVIALLMKNVIPGDQQTANSTIEDKEIKYLIHVSNLRSLFYAQFFHSVKL